MPVIDHKQFIAGLAPEERESLLAKSDAAGFIHLTAHLGLIVLFGALIIYGVPFWPLLMVPQGILLIFLFTTLHEVSHVTAFKTERLNRLVALFTGFLVFVQPLWFLYFHLAHHRHTHDVGLDPELEGGKPETVWA
jgi:fatty acid desaturase